MVSLPKRQMVGLHNHTEYSLLDGVLNAREFVKAAKDKNIDAFAITEHGSCASAMGFYLESVEQGIKPIFGLEAYLVDDATVKTKDMKSSHIVLLARNEKGFHNLLRFSNVSWTENFYYKPKIDFRNLREYSEGVTALTACMGGVLSSAIRFDGMNGARERLKVLRDIFSDNLYLEMQLMEEVYGPDMKRVEKKIRRMKSEEERKEKKELLKRERSVYEELLARHVSQLAIQPDYEEKMRRLLGDSWVDQVTVNKAMYVLHQETGTPYILTGDCHYPRKGQHKLQDLIIRVGFGNYKKARQGADEKSASTGRGYYSAQLYIKNNHEYDRARRRWHPYMPRGVLCEAIRSTHKVADSVNTSIPIGQHQLPKFDLPSHRMYKAEDDALKLFRRMVRRGFKRHVLPAISSDPEFVKQYEERLEYEMGIIAQANFLDYFLIIEDIVRWARANNITCVARGSVAGSLVAYALDITGIDPIRYHLLFERFLNPTRVSGERAKAADALPDIDLDFERHGRPRVKRYIVEKYGKDRVCTIGSYGTMGVKMLVQDFARVLDFKIGEKQYDPGIIRKLTANIEGNVKTIEEACQASSEFAKFYEENKGWFETYVRPLVGQIKSASRHAAGVLITPTPFTEWVPVRTQILEDEDGEEEGKIVISQWEDIYCERRGLLKLDILGVKQLDVFHRCFDLVRANHGVDLTFDAIETDDQAVFRKFHRGDNYGVFQFNSALQSDYMRQMKPVSVEDLCASNALLRPGPMQADAHTTFVKLRRGEVEPEYDHACIRPYLGATQGLMIYQEQVMQVAHYLGGLSLGEADMMRSAIKKFDREKMSVFQEKFVKGAMSKGLTQKHANKVWDKIVAFSGYGFNLSHAATYALQGYYCQWLKTYFPIEFYAATLEHANDDVKKNENIYSHRMHATGVEGIEFVNPAINGPALHFEIIGGKICWPLRAIKGVGLKAAGILEGYRSQEPFKSLADFYERVDKRAVNKKVVMALVQAGAFSAWGRPEQVLREYFDLKKEKKGYPEALENLTDVQWKKIEDKHLGFISVSYKEMMADKFTKQVLTAEQFRKKPNHVRVNVGGLVTKFREYKARNGLMGFMTVEDKDESYEVVIFASSYSSLKRKPMEGAVVEVRGTKGLSPRNEVQVIVGGSGDDVFHVAR